ncbi:MAG: hypothetical protein IM545_06455 [Chitinophagaceae bacterium]|nr:hypothetical protein [Chitinophagaceae bacterium]MCA6499998.1 hypothetical protein [Chitinophagaceae bacterium]
MKNLSLQLEDDFYQQPERITAKLRMARNRILKSYLIYREGRRPRVTSLAHKVGV